MNTLFIKIFFSIVCLFIFFYVLSFSLYEIKTNKNVLGGIFTIFITVGCIIFSNIIFWVNQKFNYFTKKQQEEFLLFFNTYTLTLFLLVSSTGGISGIYVLSEFKT